MKHLLIFFVLLLSACESDYTAPRTSEEIMECIRDADNDAYRAEVQFKDGDDYNNITQDVYFPEKGYNRSIYECTEAPAEFKAPANTLLTYNPKTNRLYIHLLDYPMGSMSVAFGDKIDYVQFLHDASEIKMKKNGDGSCILLLPIEKPNTEIPVLEVFLKK